MSWSLSGYYNNKKNRSLNNYERVESANDMARFSDMPNATTAMREILDTIIHLTFLH